MENKTNILFPYDETEAEELNINEINEQMLSKYDNRSHIYQYIKYLLSIK